jgi:hypothetical protein
MEREDLTGKCSEELGEGRFHRGKIDYYLMRLYTARYLTQNTLGHSDRNSHNHDSARAYKIGGGEFCILV